MEQPTKLLWARNREFLISERGTHVELARKVLTWDQAQF